MLAAANAIATYVALPGGVGLLLVVAAKAVRSYGRKHEQRTRARPNYPNG